MYLLFFPGACSRVSSLCGLEASCDIDASLVCLLCAVRRVASDDLYAFRGLPGDSLSCLRVATPVKGLGSYAFCSHAPSLFVI